MSASERLKELGAMQEANPHVFIVQSLALALPEIITVVEAAEWLKDAERAKDVQRLVTAGLAIGEALTALDAKLTTKGER